MIIVKRAAAAVFDTVFPRNCVICGKSMFGEPDPAAYLCPSCAPEIEYSAEESCSVCSKLLVSEKIICMKCRLRQYAFRRSISLFSYAGTAKRLLQLYKFEGYKTLGSFFAKQLYIVLGSEYGQTPVIPVPSRKNAKKKRGWDHVERISHLLRSSYGVQVLPLLKREGKRAQKTLNYEERLLNMKGSILPNRRCGDLPENVVLLDDVFTTGATASECALVLKQMGVGRINVLTIAID